MKITKYDQSCYILEKEEKVLVFDPVEYDTKLPEISGVEAIVVTHLHGDHFMPEVIARIRALSPEARVFTTEDNVANIEGAEAVKGGDKISVGSFSLEFFGGKHAPIVADESPCMNVGAVVDGGEFANPGDSFDVPPVPVRILAVATSAPWMRVYDAMKYISEVRPKAVLPEHDSLLSELGKTVSNNWISKACEEAGAEFRVLGSGESSEI